MQSIIDLYMQTNPEEIKIFYNLLNARVNYKFNKFIGAFIKTGNILNERYEINDGYPMPGFTAYIGISLHFSK